MSTCQTVAVDQLSGRQFRLAVRFRVIGPFSCSRSIAEMEPVSSESDCFLVRHEGHTPRERSACGWRDRLISREDAALSPVAWAHAVDIDGAKLHYHKRSTELYY